jgi:DNA-binding response OmpR family regulator
MSKRIVVVDDDMEITDIIKTTLKTKGFEVGVAHNGQDGLKLISESQPDLIILDLMLPLISGMEVIKRLRRDEHTKDIPVLVMSAIAKSSDKSEEFWRQGLRADDFITKPFDPLALLGRVEYVLRKRDYVSATDPSGLPLKSAQPAIDLNSATPKQVVKAFIEAWNSQDFATEFKCLADEMTGGLSRKEYLGRRRQFFTDEKGASKQQTCESIVESSQSRNVAKVVCVKKEQHGHMTKRTEEAYVLRKTASGWKIASVRARPKSDEHDAE